VAQPRSPAHLAYGTAIREARTQRGISQERLAQLAGLDRTYFSGVERGERNASLANLLRIADSLGVRFSEIARRAEELIGEQPPEQ
jgi:transcriptional regulator with XRE-family HTH domain